MRSPALLHGSRFRTVGNPGVFQTVSDLRLSRQSVLASLLLHCAGMVLLCLVGSGSSTLGLRAQRRFIQVALTAPAPKNPARPIVQTPRKPTPRTPSPLAPRIAPRRFEALPQ